MWSPGLLSAILVSSSVVFCPQTSGLTLSCDKHTEHHQNTLFPAFGKERDAGVVSSGTVWFAQVGLKAWNASRSLCAKLWPGPRPRPPIDALGVWVVGREGEGAGRGPWLWRMVFWWPPGEVAVCTAAAWPRRQRFLGNELEGARVSGAQISRPVG